MDKLEELKKETEKLRYTIIYDNLIRNMSPTELILHKSYIKLESYNLLKNKAHE